MSFLSAQWRRLAMFNYTVDPELLQPFVPAHTELDLWQGRCYVSLVGFMFQDVRLRGWRIPWHVNFEEINFRFYVRHCDPVDGWRRGVVFLSELVPKSAIAWVANTVYKENYRAVPMGHLWEETGDALKVEYSFQMHHHFHQMGVVAENRPVDLKAGSEAEFITEHYWGYARVGKRETMQYQVKHPRWQVYPIRQWAVEVDFGLVYGQPFELLKTQLPHSVFLAEGSVISVENGSKITH